MGIYYKVDNAINDSKIEKIFDIFKKEKEYEAAFLLKGDLNKDYRSTKLKWSDNSYLYDLVWPYMLEANKAWDLEISAAESFQLGKYEVGDHYDYHMDGNMLETTQHSSRFLNNKTRKISMVCWLNEDFEGGEFEMREAEKSSRIIKPKKGDMLFFPSFYVHKVHKVTKGTRYSLVTWFVGEKIR